MIIYDKLAGILKEKNLQWKDLCNAGIGVNTPAKFSHNRNVNTDSIDKVCAFLKVQPGDIMEWVENENQAEILSLQRQKEELEAKIAELQAKE